MAKLTKFAPKLTPDGWRINVPAKFAESGKRERHFFKSKTLAEAASKEFREKRKEFGEQARSIAPTLAEQATAAAKLLEPFGVTVLQAAQFFAEAETRKLASAAIESALDAFTLAKEGKSDSQTRAYRYMADALREDFPERNLSTIRAEELMLHIEERTGGPAAFNLRARLISAFWRWCAKKPREWCNADAVAHFETKDGTKGEIGTLTPAQARALMTAAEENYPECVPAYAIALFTGLRQAEISRLDPGDVTADGLTVPAGMAKTGKRRFIHMPDPLAEWLKAYPVGDTILPVNFVRKDKAIRRLAGFRVWSGYIEPHEAPADLPEWPGNAFRHTAASVALALGKAIETLVFEHGHAGGLNTLRNHYIGRMTKKDALAIVSIGPRGVKLKTIAAA